MVTGIDPKTLITQSRQRAAEHMGRIKNAPALTFELLHRELSAFILCKFLLNEDGEDTANFDELAKLSLSRSMKVSKELVEQFDLAKSCDGVSSVMAKKVLLFMAIQKELGIILPAEQTASAETLRDISVMVWNALEA
jgi:hypothetical protein